MQLVPASDYWNTLVRSRETAVLALIYRLPPRFWRHISQVQQELRAVDGRQLFTKPSTLHITIKVLRTLDERFDPQKLELMLRKTQEIVSDFPAFEVSLKGLSYFPTALYIRVEDSLDQFRMINKRLISEFGDEIAKSEFDGDAYIPHVTIATFNTKEAPELISKIKSAEMQEVEFGDASILELEAVEARMYLLIGPEDLQDQGFAYLRSFLLVKGR